MTIRMCIATGVPLVESGTAGYEGQVNVHVDQKTACFDCNPRPPTKTYPICTIRHTPDKPIHCIVWAKSYLFPELFGTSEEDSSDVQVTEGDDVAEVAKLASRAIRADFFLGIGLHVDTIAQLLCARSHHFVFPITFQL